MTPFTEIYERFYDYITDDMYMEITPEQTKEDCQGLLLNSIPLFEFPEQVLDYKLEKDFSGEDISYFIPDLTLEEKNILATGMY